MKEFFKKPIIHYTTVLTIVAIVCGLLIGGVNAITAPVIARNEIEAQNRAYREVLPDGQSFEEISLEGTPATIRAAVKGLDAQGNIVGYIYIASGTNQYGNMSIAISIDANGMILGAQFVSIEQTLNVEGTRTNLSRYVKTQISALRPEGDLISGVTGSLNTVKALLADVLVAHEKIADIPLDPYSAMFGQGFTKTADSSFVANDFVKSKEIVKDSSGVEIGFLYRLNGISIYNSDSGAAGSITMYVGVDNSQKILGIVVPEEEYQHTVRNFMNQAVTYAQTYVGKSISEIDSTGSDITAGATNSKTLMNQMLAALKEVVLG